MDAPDLSPEQDSESIRQHLTDLLQNYRVTGMGSTGRLTKKTGG
jgi:hypothetical protein